MTITIRRLDKHVINDSNFEELLEHLNEPLRVRSIWFKNSTEMDHIVVELPSHNIVTLFGSNNVFGHLSSMKLRDGLLI